MENLTFNSINKLDTTNFVRIGDLSYFEGPLLSLFEELNSGHLYVFDWVDRDHKFNRWLIYRVSPKYLLQFLRGELSHLELFESRPNITIYFTDIDAKNKSFFHYDAYQLKNLPNNYIPNRDNYFQQSDCISFEKIKSVVINSLTRQKSENEYSKYYTVSFLKRREVIFSYFNRYKYNINAISFLVEHSKSFKFEDFDHVTSNTVEWEGFMTGSSFKISESKKRKEYANQYN